MGSMEKQFEGLEENLHKKMHQAGGIWHNQRNIILSQMHQKKAMDSQHIYICLMYLEEFTAVS